MSYTPSRNRVTTLQISSTTLGTSGSPADIASVVVPSRLAKYFVKAVYVRADTASGSLADATIDLRTDAAGAGNSVLSSPTALTSLVGVDTAQSLPPVALTVQSSRTLYVYQTTDSSFAGTLVFTIELVDLS